MNLTSETPALSFLRYIEKYILEVSKHQKNIYSSTVHFKYFRTPRKVCFVAYGNDYILPPGKVDGFKYPRSRCVKKTTAGI